MKIGIDARLYGISDRGIGRYTEKLIDYLEKIDFENEYFIFLRKEGFKNYQPTNPHFHKVLADFRSYSIKEQIIFSFKLYSYNLDLVHFPHFNVPIFYRRPFVITIHDLIISRFPKSRATTLPYFLYKIKLIGYQFVLKNAVKAAKKIIAVSEFTKKEIVEILKIKPEKIVVIYEGVDKLPITNYPVPTEVGTPASRSLPITNPYILYVGAAYPHKNLERLLKAFKQLIIPTKVGIPTSYLNKTKVGIHNSSTHQLLTHLKLILVGRKDFFYQRLEKYSQNLGLNERVIFKGETSDKELSFFYQKALFLIFPSLCEGFGLPGLEAMAYGTPVAASSVSSLPEVFGEAACYFNPYDTNEITETIKKITTDKNLRKNLKEKGFSQIKRYSWQKLAQKTLEIYKLAPK